MSIYRQSSIILAHSIGLLLEKTELDLSNSCSAIIFVFFIPTVITRYYLFHEY